VLRRIVIGYDGRPEAEDALALAIGLAQATGAELTIGHVFDEPTRWFGTTRIYSRERREELHSVFEPALAAVPDDVDVTTLALGAWPAARGLHDLAISVKADIVVIGSTHRGRVGRVLPGSAGEGFLMGAPCAVAVAPRGYRDARPARIASVGVGYDGSDEAAAALAAADRLARGFGADLRAIAVDGHHHPADPQAHPFRARLDDALESVGRSPDDDGRLVAGDPVDELCSAAGDVDLMVAGSRGYGPMRHVLLGSVSGPLIRACPCPLVVFPRSAAVPAAAAEEPTPAAG